MRCQSCGAKLKGNEEICAVCGFYNDREKLSLENDDLGNLDNFKDPDIDEEIELLDDDNDSDIVLDDNIDSSYYDDMKNEKDENDNSGLAHYVEIYIGEDYKWIVERPFNIYALLLSWIYFLYRKLYIIGILGLVLTGFFVKLYKPILPYYVVIVMLICGLLFNPIYLFVVKRRVKRLRNRYGEGSDLEDECYKKGGVNTPRALLIFCIFLGILLLTFIHIDFGRGKPNFWKENNENQANCLLVAKKAYSMVEKKLILGNIEDAICYVRITNTKNHDIYLRILDGEKYQYYYIKNDGKYLSIEGDTTQVENWQREKEKNNILKEEEEMLNTSLALPDKYSEMIEYSNIEEKKINEGVNTSERLYYYLKKEDIYPKK